MERNQEYDVQPSAVKYDLPGKTSIAHTIVEMKLSGPIEGGQRRYLRS